MIEYTPDGIRQLMLDLVAVPSVSGSSEENTVANRIYEFLSAESYFQAHPDFLCRIPTESTGLQRNAVMAFVQATTPTARTLLLTGHHDVVDTDVYGECSQLAYDPIAYTARASERVMPKDAHDDLASGEYLFGRGTMDMKAGLALHMAYLCHRAKEAAPLNINLLFLSVPDEEANSVGMRGALPALVNFLQSRHLRCVAAFTGEPAFWSSGTDPYRIYYTGTTGKIMPVFYCVGREAHVGYYYDGVNAATLAAHVTTLMDGNPRFIEGTGGETLCPPTCLKLSDRRGVYSVTLAERAVAYFNVLTMSKTPLTVLNTCRDVAAEALRITLEHIQCSGAAYAQATGAPNPVPAWAPRVLSYREVYLQTVETLQVSCGSEDKARAYLDEQLALVLRHLPQHPEDPQYLDQREQGLAVFDRLISLSGLKGPAIVVGFVPPFYPPRLNQRRTADERRLRAIMETVTHAAQQEVGNVRLIECFGGITDLSFLGFSGTVQELETLSDNMPGWGKVYDLPIDALMKLNVPVANMGPAGKDAHKDTERLELPYSFDVAPRLLHQAVTALEASE